MRNKFFLLTICFSLFFATATYPTLQIPLTTSQSMLIFSALPLGIGWIFGKIFVSDKSLFNFISLLFDLSFYTYIILLISAYKTDITIFSWTALFCHSVVLFSFIITLYKHIVFQDTAQRDSKLSFSVDIDDSFPEQDVFSKIQNNTLSPLRYEDKYHVVFIWILIIHALLFYQFNYTPKLLGLSPILLYTLQKFYTKTTLIDYLFLKIKGPLKYINYTRIAHLLNTETNNIISTDELSLNSERDILKYADRQAIMYDIKKHKYIKGETQLLHELSTDKFYLMFNSNSNLYIAENNPFIFIHMS